jgi:hypothetical protein
MKYDIPNQEKVKQLIKTFLKEITMETPTIKNESKGLYTRQYFVTKE